MQDILFYRVAAQHHKNLFAAEQLAVHRIKRVGYQILIEGIVEYDALALQQVERRMQIVVIQLKAAAVDRAVKCREVHHGHILVV